MITHDNQVSRYLAELYSEDRRLHSFQGTKAADVEAWRQQARPELRALIGLNTIRRQNGDFPPSVSLAKREDLGDYWRIKGTLESEPGFYIPFWWLVPKGDGPFPLALLPHGHYQENGLDFAAGAGNNFSHQYGEGGHRYYGDLMWPFVTAER
jgi:hypothetical protein